MSTNKKTHKRVRVIEEPVDPRKERAHGRTRDASHTQESRTRRPRVARRTFAAQARETAVLAKKFQPVWTLTLEVIEELCKYLSEGLPIQTACDLAMVPYGTFKAWHAKALAWFASEGKDESLELYGRFSLATREAMASWKRKMAKRAARKNSTFWVAPVTLLERRDRKHYGQKEPEGGTVETMNPSELFR